ncbi:Alpha/Beta hydrolase protein [Cyathus striatus]|nr:Alpha/Beta hydrolase protein [Cyathus striatus]
MKRLLLPFCFLYLGSVSAEPLPRDIQKEFSISHEPSTTIVTDNSPNLGSRLEFTATGIIPFNCTKNKYASGYVHFTSDQTKKEDKHMFWWFIEALNDPEDAPLVLTFGGGPGTAGTLFSFLGPGPCKIQAGEDGKPFVIPSDFAWTSDVNILAIDHPVGVGYSYGDTLRNSSFTAALDMDDLLQAFWRLNIWQEVSPPRQIMVTNSNRNKFMINSGSYGGTYIPHIVNAIFTRNHDHSKLDRVIKMPDAIMMSNVWSDTKTMFRWFHESNCGTGVDSNPFLNETACADVVSILPACLDALQLAYEQPTLEYKMEGFVACVEMQRKLADPAVGRNLYDYREKCPEEGCDPLAKLLPIQQFANSTEVKNATGVSNDIEYLMVSDKIHQLFVLNGDMVQPSYKLLGPAIEAGLRVLVYNGLADGRAPWRSSLSWMKLLKTKHQHAFRAAKEVKYPLSYSVQKAGFGEAGEFAFVKVWDAGHFIVEDRSELVKNIMLRWIHNKSWNITENELKV